MDAGSSGTCVSEFRSDRRLCGLRAELEPGHAVPLSVGSYSLLSQGGRHGRTKDFTNRINHLRVLNFLHTAMQRD